MLQHTASLQVLAILLTFNMVLTGLSMHDSSATKRVTALAFLTLSLIFIGGLLAFHTFLGATGQVTRDVLGRGSGRGRRHKQFSASRLIAGFCRFICGAQTAWDEEGEVAEGGEQLLAHGFGGRSPSSGIQRMAACVDSCCDNRWYSCC